MGFDSNVDDVSPPEARKGQIDGSVYSAVY
jgi:hypothetical protein